MTLPSLLQLSLIHISKDSKVSIEGESDKLKETAQNATEAANAKLKFVDANNKVKDSAKDSADAVQGESDSFKNVNTDPYSTCLLYTS